MGASVNPPGGGGGGGTGEVSSVNGKSGVVVLAAADIGADPAGTATAAITTHVAAPDPHGDRAYADAQVNALADATDTALAGKVGTSDPRLSDARTPTPHTHPLADIDAAAIAGAVDRILTVTPTGTLDSAAMPPQDSVVGVNRLALGSWGMWVAGAAVPPNSARACAAAAWFAIDDCLLTGVVFEVVAGAVGAIHGLALHQCDEAGRPGDRVYQFADFDCSTSGLKQRTGLTIPIVGGRVYRLVSLAGATAGHTVRGLSTGTAGLPLTAAPISPSASLSTGGDNVVRGAGYRYTAVAGVPQASPTWDVIPTFLEIPNFGITLGAA